MESQADVAACFMLLSCLVYSTLKKEAKCSSETSVDFNGLSGGISQKIQPFITTAVRTSNLIRLRLFGLTVREQQGASETRSYKKMAEIA
jgi:hypothetical protein